MHYIVESAHLVAHLLPHIPRGVGTRHSDSGKSILKKSVLTISPKYQHFRPAKIEDEVYLDLHEYHQGPSSQGQEKNSWIVSIQLEKSWREAFQREFQNDIAGVENNTDQY